MEFTGERYLPKLKEPEISYEHWHRYQHATSFTKNKFVLDIACGEGYGSFLLAQSASYVVGVDKSSEVINHASSTYIHNNLEYKIGSVDQIPLPGSGFLDVVVSFETIEHVDQDQQIAFMKEVKRLLKPDGVLIISTPNKETYSDEPNYANEFHKKEYYVPEFLDFLRQYFKYVDLYGQKIYPISYIWNMESHNDLLQNKEFRLKFTPDGFQPTNEQKQPMYIIALCSDTEIVLRNKTQSIQIDLSNRLSAHRDEYIQELTKNLNNLNQQLQTITQQIDNYKKQIQEMACPSSSLDERLARLFVAQYGRQVLEELLAIFDKNWYLCQYPEVSGEGLSAFWDYLQNGVRDKRNPCSLFDTNWYIQKYPEVNQSNISPLLHYVIEGANKGYHPSPDFDTSFYLEMYPDVRNCGMNPLRHYLEFGKKEKRLTKPGLLQPGRMSSAEMKTPGFHGFLEAIYHHASTLFIEGWAFHEKAIITYVNVVAKTEKKVTRFPGRYGWYRGDLENAYPFNQATQSGFAVKANVETDEKTFFYLEFGLENGEVVSQPLGNYVREEQSKSKPFTLSTTWLSGENISLQKGSLEDVLDLYLKEIPQSKPLGQTIDIIIPVYKAMQYLPRLFDSIFRNTTEPYRLIIVDDGNKDKETQQFLQEVVRRKPDTILIHHPTNLGFVVSCNDAFSYVRNHFVLLNTDVEVPPYWLERLMSPILNNPQIASTTPFTNSGTVCSFPKFLENNEIFADASVEALDQIFSHIDTSRLEISMPSGVGFCMGMNYKVAKEIGLFDAETFGLGHGEENDWCMRARNAGYRNILVPNLFVWHKHGGTWGEKKKSELESRNLKLLAEKHPNYLRDVQDFIRADPAGPLRDFLILLGASKLSKNPPYLIIDHDLGGGANFYRNDKVRELKQKGHPVLLILWKQDEHKHKLHFYYNEHFVQYEIGSTESLKHFLIDQIPISDIFVNELVSYPDVMEWIEFILEIATLKGCNLSLAIHDYFSLCPSYTLLNYKNQYCDLPTLDVCQKCLPMNNNITFSWDTEIAEWRKKWRELFQHSSEILCFSNNSKELIARVYPEISSRIIVRPHKVNYLIDHRPTLNFSQELHIAVVGSISLPKGSQVVYSIAQQIEKQRLPIKLSIIGWYNGERLPNWVRITGPYKRSELPIIIEEIGANIFFFPSICPETFSYVCEELMQLKVPLACFNLGAPAERVRNYPMGKVISEINPELVLKELVDFYHEVRAKFLEKSMNPNNNRS